MRAISDIQGEAAVDLIADLIDPIATIATDEKVLALFEKEQVPEGADIRKLALARLRANVPALIKSHKKEVLAILAIIDGKSVADYTKHVTALSLAGDLIKVLNDEAFVDFFTSQLPSVTTDDTESGDTSTVGDTPLNLV